jgi:putative redox protein
MSTIETVLHHLVDKRFIGVTPDGLRVPIDGEAAHRTGMGPMQLVLNALAGCAAYDVVEMLRKRRLTIRAYRVEAVGERSGGTPSPLTKAHLRHVFDVPGLDQHTADRFVELAVTKYCSVASSLHAVQTFEAVLEAGADDPAADDAGVA